MLYLFESYIVPLLFLAQYFATNAEHLVPERKTGCFQQPLRELADARLISLSLIRARQQRSRGRSGHFRSKSKHGKGGSRSRRETTEDLPTKRCRN